MATYLGRCRQGLYFSNIVAEELARARSCFPRPQVSAHEGFALLKEEIDELWDIVKLKPHDRDPDAMFKELVQIAAISQRMAEEIVLGGKVNDY